MATKTTAKKTTAKKTVKKATRPVDRVTSEFKGKFIPWNLTIYEVSVVDHKGVLRKITAPCFMDYTKDAYGLMLPSFGLKSEKDTGRVIAVATSSSLKAQFRAENAPINKLRKELDKELHGRKWNDVINDIGAMTKVFYAVKGDKCKIYVPRYTKVTESTPNQKKADTLCLKALKNHFEALYKAEAKLQAKG